MLGESLAHVITGCSKPAKWIEAYSMSAAKFCLSVISPCTATAEKGAEPNLANQFYKKVVDLITQQGVSVEKGIFGEYMHVTSTNDGPVNFILDSTRLF